MSDLLSTFRDRAQDLITSINAGGGLRATIDGLRRQMAASDRRRAINKVKSELKRLDRQITEMITAVGVQAVGLHKSGRLHAPELEPLCEHIIELEAALAQQKAALARMEAEFREQSINETPRCLSCGREVPEGATFCPYCGATVPTRPQARTPEESFCAECGARLREGARFCAKCGQRVGQGS